MKTVGDLIKRLQDFDPNARILVQGPDCGGYDWCWKADFEATGYPNVPPNGLVRLEGMGDNTNERGRTV